jgi:type IV pilus assembly protein PilN
MTSISNEALNLASQPFRKERAQNATYAAACAALLCSLFVLAGMVLHERAAAAGIRKEIDAEQTRLQALQKQQAGFSNVLAKPQNADVFATNVFLNELIARRSVSWTKVFEDLKTVVPSNMRVEVIRLPQIGAQETGGVNHVQLDMVIGTDRPEALHNLLQNLESSDLFGAASVVNQTPPTQNDPLYKYRVMVSYAQKL